MVTRACVVAVVLSLPGLSGCAGLASGQIGPAAGGAASSIESTINGIAPGIDQIVPQLMLDKYISLHNLMWEMWQVDQTQGPVVTVPVIGGITPPPVPVTPTPVPPPVTPPLPTPTPAPGGTLPTGPTGNG